jgi:hypothetical protein
MSGVPVDVIHELYAGFDTMPEHVLSPWQADAIAEAKAAAQLT